MKKYKVTVDGVEYLVQVTVDEAGIYTAKLGEKEVKVRLEEIIDLKKRKTQPTTISSTEPTTQKKIPSDIEAGAGGVLLRAPMPGNVVKIIAQEDSTVKQGEPVIILEAMKMNNEIPSPVSGTIKEIKVKEGETIDSEDIIAIIEEEPE
ncbi:MAG: hypothetical protein JSV25_00900 [Spirochaetota bacterium]|nr:MAG: hypothetical protein JSV25_00900 [Spirochaetota bacterium]